MARCEPANQLKTGSIICKTANSPVIYFSWSDELVKQAGSKWFEVDKNDHDYFGIMTEYMLTSKIGRS